MKSWAEIRVQEFLRTLRRQPAPLVGTFVALVLAAILVTVAASLIGTGETLKPPAQRLAAASVVVAGDQNVAIASGQGQSAKTDVRGLPAYRGLPASLARAAAAMPGVAVAVPDVSIPLALRLNDGRVITGGPGHELTGYGWQSAVLTPFTISAGHAPAASNQIVLGDGIAQLAGLRPGDTVRLAGRDLAPFTVVGLAAAPAGDPARDQAVFLTSAEAAALYGHPGRADLIGVIAAPGSSATALAQRIHGAPGFGALTVLTGPSLGQAEDPNAAIDGFNLSQLGMSAGVDIVLIALFVVAGTVSLSVAQRRRSIALLRAIGATPRQIRQMIMTELAILGAAAGVAGYLPGAWLAAAAVRGMAAHQVVPPATQAWTNSWTSGWVVFITAGVGIIVAELAGLAAIRRASRPAPAAALGQADPRQRRPRPVRLVSGLILLVGGVVGGMASLFVPLSAVDQLNLVLVMLLALLGSIALLGPLLVAVAAGVFRLPVLLVSRAAGRLGLAEIRVRPQRAAAALSSIALAVTFTGAIYVIDASQVHAAAVQGNERLTAPAVVSAPGPGLSPAVLPDIAGQPGVAAAVGLTPTTVFVPYPGNPSASAEAVSGGPLAGLLNLKVSSGTLRGFGPGDIALSSLVTGKTAVNVQVGQGITAYLADGTPYQATVTAIYDQSLGFGDVLIPAGAAGGGHLGTPAIGQVLVGAAPHVTAAALARHLAPLATRFPGLSVAGRSAVVNEQAELFTAQVSYANNLVLGAIAALAGLALVNTLVMATVERRGSLRLLRRVGATTRQLLAMTWWQTVVLSVSGIVIGAGAAAVTVIVATKAMTGAWTPTATWPPVVIITGTVLVLTMAAVFTPTAWFLTAHEDE